MNELEPLVVVVFFFFTAIYFFAVTGSDHVVTGKIDPEVKEEIFKAYVFWESIQNQAIAYGWSISLYILGVSSFTIIMVYTTVTWVWFGGGLDFVWHGFKGEMPPLDKIWWWMPFHPTTLEFAVYAVAWFVLLVAGWIVNFAGVLT